MPVLCLIKQTQVLEDWRRPPERHLGGDLTVPLHWREVQGNRTRLFDAPEASGVMSRGGTRARRLLVSLYEFRVLSARVRDLG